MTNSAWGTLSDQAVAFARQTRPDLMIVDIRLEGDGDGIGAAREIYAGLGEAPMQYQSNGCGVLLVWTKR